MIQVLLRVAVWVLVLGIGYLVIGPKMFDSSEPNSPFASGSALFLPPAKTDREVEYEARAGEAELSAAELAEYRRLIQERKSKFWQREGVSVEQALSGVNMGRRERLAEILEQRGLSKDEVSVFLHVVERDHPMLLADCE